MNHTELGALRRLLMFSAAEAARWVAADDERPDGVEERTWNRWEGGKVPVPQNVATAILGLAKWRADYVRTMSNRVAHLWQATSSHVALTWYVEADDFLGPPERWRPYCSALATIYEHAERGELDARVTLVTFEPGPYQRWRQAEGLADDGDAHARWTEEQAAHPLRAKDRAA